MPRELGRLLVKDAQFILAARTGWPATSRALDDRATMSWKATAWAKETIGHKSIGQKFLLMVLADYAHPETHECFPSQKVLAEQCMITERTVINCMNRLEANGFVTRLKKGNQHQPSLYRINMVSLAAIHEDEGPSSMSESAQIYEGEAVSLSHAVDLPVKVKPEPVNVKPEASECEIPVGTNRHEPSLEPSLLQSVRKKPKSEKRVTEITPDFRTKMQERFGFRLNDIDERIDEALGNRAALKWMDLQAYVRGWLRRDAERSQNGTGPGPPKMALPLGHDPNEDQVAKYRLADENAKARKATWLRDHLGGSG